MEVGQVEYRQGKSGELDLDEVVEQIDECRQLGHQTDQITINQYRNLPGPRFCFPPYEHGELIRWITHFIQLGLNLRSVHGVFL